MSSERVFEDAEWLRLIEICSLCSLPIALKAAINLGVFDILQEALDEKHARSSEHLSSAQIVTRMQRHHHRLHTPNPQSLDRILRLLASHAILTASSVPSAAETSPDVSTTIYGLTPLCKHLLRGAAFSPFAVFMNTLAHLEAWGHVDEALVDPGASPFSLAHNKDLFTYTKEKPEFGALFNTAMDKQSQAPMEGLLYRTNYGGFVGISSLVDVGGNLGACLHEIMRKHPHIKGINFDMPHVIEEARRLNAYPEIEHIGGSMFESIPKADAVFMKHILHDWADEDCIRILRNCYDAVPVDGKVIVMDVALPAGVQADLVARVSYQMDLCMYAQTPGGRERTLEQFEVLAKSAGFGRPRVACRVNHVSVMELFKS